MRVIGVFILLGLIFLVPFLIWGEQFEQEWNQQFIQDLLLDFGIWGWAVAIGLLCSDLILPVPASVVMSGLGSFYGWALGGMVATIGLFLAGLLGYGLCYLLGDHVALWLCGEKDLQRARRFLDRWGGIAVAGSRFLPLIPEAITCLAGMTRMNFRRFCFALLCGSLPTGYAYATLGHFGRDNLGGTTIIAALIPLLLWLPIYVFILRKQDEKAEAATQQIEPDYAKQRRSSDDSSMSDGTRAPSRAPRRKSELQSNAARRS